MAALLSRVYAPWPEGYWPDQTAGLQASADEGATHVLGSAKRTENGVVKITFSKQANESQLAVLAKASVCTEEDELSDVAYDLFGGYLEEEGVNHLTTLREKRFAALVSDKVPDEIGSLFECVGVECFEGMEDLDVKSIILLEDGNLGVEATFNLRRVEMTVACRIEEYESLKDKIEEADFFYYPEKVEGNVASKIYIRPYFRVSFSMDVGARRPEKLRVVALSIPEKRNDWRRNVTLH